jgi:hypothetical protein
MSEVPLKPETRNPKPETRNPKPETPKLEARNPETRKNETQNLDNEASPGPLEAIKVRDLNVGLLALYQPRADAGGYSPARFHPDEYS